MKILIKSDLSSFQYEFKKKSGWNALALQASDGDLCVLQLQKERTARMVHRRYGWRQSQPVILEHCKLGATSYLVTKPLFFIMKHIGSLQKTTNYAK